MKRQAFDALTGAAAATLFALAALAAASASSNASAQTQATSAVGGATRAWLELQRGGQAAAPALPTLGAQAGLAYQRYLDSFKTKIPAMYGSAISGQRADSSGSSNGGSASAASN